MATNRNQQPKNTQAAKRRMLAALAQTGNVTAAAIAARSDRTIHYDWLRDDPQYALAAREAMEEAADRLEIEARRRAETGTEEPVFGRVDRDMDGQIGTVRKYSDTLLIFLLKGAKPEKYKERAEVKHTGRVQHGVSLTDLSESDLDSLDAIAEKLAPRGSGGGAATD